MPSRASRAALCEKTGISSDTFLSDTLTYRGVGTERTTGYVHTLTSEALNYDVTYTYTYDDNGNILSVSDGTNKTTYVYDSANQLIRENNQAAGQTLSWSYDNAGNIVGRGFYNYSTGDPGAPTYVMPMNYDDSSWGDLLTEIPGATFTYDAIGNLTHAGAWSYSWEHGRELTAMTNSVGTWNFTYDANGLRTKRTNGTRTYSYIYNGGSLSRMTVDSHTLDFTYDASGTPISVTYDGTPYFYATNLQGDVLAILNTSGTAVVTYTYDAWGTILSQTGSLVGTLGYYNPLRYRSYVYDEEFGLYYLQSRYYNAGLGRFNAPDAFAATGQGILGNNTYAYCNNNPVSRADDGGYFWDIVFDVASLVASIVEVVQNPNDVGAWIGLALDVVDVAVPCVGGLGEIADAVNVARKAADTADDILDIGKASDNLGEFADVIIDEFEIKCPQQIKVSEAIDAWDDFLGPNQTNYNKFTGNFETNRIFSADGNRSIRLTSHEMDSFGTTKAHFHYEEWLYNPDTNTVLILNQLQRVK